MPVQFLTRGPIGFAVLACCSFLVLVFAGPANCPAQIAATQRDQLIELAQAARETLDAQRFPSSEPAGAKVISAVAAVADYLAPRTDQKNLADWMQYISADPLVEAIRTGAPAEEIASHARRVRGRLIGDIEGLELAAMTQLRGRVEQLITSLRFEDPDAAIRLVDQQLEALTRRLQSAEQLTSPEDAAALSAITGLLHESDQVQSLVTAMRSAYSQPNIIVTIDGAVIGRAVSRDVGQSRPVRDCILGTTIIGTAALHGQLVGKLAPCHGRVQIDLVLTGQFNSNTVGYNGPVRLPTVGRGHVTASRSLWLDESTRSLSPTQATATLKSTITSIDHPLRIVRRIAQRQIAQKQPQAERIAAGRLWTQVAADFDRQTSQAVRGGAAGGAGPLSLVGGGSPLGLADPVKDTRVKLARLNLSEPVRTVGSTSQSVYIQATQRAEAQLAAASSPPPLADLISSAEQRRTTDGGPTTRFFTGDAHFDAAIQVHESVLDNVAARILAGSTVTGAQIDRLLASNGRPLIGTQSEEVEQEPFEIDFSNFRPVILELRDQSVRLGLRGTRFSQGNRELVRPLEITVIYEPQRIEDGTMILRRNGDVSVDFPGTRRLTIQQVALRRTIQRVFTGRFPETLLDRPLIIPAASGMPFFQVQTLRPNLIDIRDGWISITAK